MMVLLHVAPPNGTIFLTFTCNSTSNLHNFTTSFTLSLIDANPHLLVILVEEPQLGNQRRSEAIYALGRLGQAVELTPTNLERVVLTPQNNRKLLFSASARLCRSLASLSFSLATMTTLCAILLPTAPNPAPACP